MHDGGLFVDNVRVTKMRENWEFEGDFAFGDFYAILRDEKTAEFSILRRRKMPLVRILTRMVH